MKVAISQTVMRSIHNGLRGTFPQLNIYHELTDRSDISISSKEFPGLLDVKLSKDGVSLLVEGCCDGYSFEFIRVSLELSDPDSLTKLEALIRRAFGL